MSTAQHQHTQAQCLEVVARARALFADKLHDYGAAWRIMRPSSLTDQIYIKANRIRTLQETNLNLVGEDIESEFVGILNYGVVAMIQLELGAVDSPDLSNDEALQSYDRHLGYTLELMRAKNHDYGEAWRMMRISSIVDLILSKIYRTKQIEDLQGQTKVSEGIAANYMDMVNYAIFCLIKLSEEK